MYLIVGSVGAIGGYIVSPDTVEGITEHTKDEVWDSAVEVISIMGLISEKNEQGGILIAKVGGAKATVNVTMLSEKVTKLTVKARRSFFPRIKTAQDIYAKVIGRLIE